MLSRLVGVVVMGHSAHRAIAGYARPPRAPRPSLGGGPARRTIEDSERTVLGPVRWLAQPLHLARGSQVPEPVPAAHAVQDVVEVEAENGLGR